MAINTLAYAQVFQREADRQLVAGATSGWMEENAGQVIYSGGREVRIPRISMQGLGDYDRDTGFAQGSVTLDYETVTMTQDRGRTFHLDAQDVDETNFVANASGMIANFQADHVIPEVDSYRYSRIYSLVSGAGHATSGYAPEADTILEAIKTDISAIQDQVGDGVPLVVSMSGICAGILDLSEKLHRYLNVTEFRSGSVSLKVRALDDIPLLRVPSDRMKTAYRSLDGRTEGQLEGGLKADSGAKQINWLVMPRRAPVAVCKTDKVRIFDPNTNQNADAWKIDFRKYHDLWVPANRLKAMRANVGA